MITQVSGINPNGVARDPRRKAQSIQFKYGSAIPYKSAYAEQYTSQKKNALWTSISIVAGSIMFTMLYFMLSALSAKKGKF